MAKKNKVFNKLLKILFIILLGVVVFYFVADPIKRMLTLSPVISTGVSTDGRYVITAHASRTTHQFSETYVVLWDVKKQTKKILAKGINPYSAYFIPESHEFMWQDKDNIMHIQNTKGEELSSFKHLFVLSHFMSADKKTYLSTSKERNVYSGYGKTIKTVLNGNNGAGFLPLYLSVAGDYFLTSNYGVSFRDEAVSETNITESPIVDAGRLVPRKFNNVTLWDKTTLKPVAWLNGHGGKVFSLLSPDGQWAISGDENRRNYMWSTHHLDKRLRLADPSFGIIFPSTKETPYHRDKSQLLDPPPELKTRVLRSKTIAYAFLTATDFIHLGHLVRGNKDHVAPLYTVGDPWIKGYVDLQEEPLASLNSYVRGLSIASSYKAHVLVTGQAYYGGINVYQYHPDKKQLARIWVGKEYKYW